MRFDYLPGWTLFEVRRDWPGCMLVTLGTGLGPELTMVGRLRLTPGTLGRDTVTRDPGPVLTPALVTRPGGQHDVNKRVFTSKETYSL